MAKKKASTKKKKGGLTLDDSVRVLALHGKETFLIADAVKRLRAGVAKTHGEVEIVHFDGTKVEAAEVLDEARSFGLMQQYKIIVVDQAEEFLKEKESGKGAGKASGNRAIVMRYCENPAEDATIVLWAERWYKSKLDAAIAKVGGVIKFDEVKHEQAVAFCMERAKAEHGTSIGEAEASTLVQRVGTTLGRLNAELSRLAVMADGGISADLIHEQVPLSREEQAWVLQTALLQSRSNEAMAKVSELMEVSRQPAVLMNYCFADLARKLFAAGRMREEGRGASEVENYLGRWNPTRFAIKDAAARVASGDFASLMADTIHSTVRTRTGLGNDRRSVDLLAVRFLDSRRGSSR